VLGIGLTGALLHVTRSNSGPCSIGVMYSGKINNDSSSAQGLSFGVDFDNLYFLLIKHTVSKREKYACSNERPKFHLLLLCLVAFPPFLCDLYAVSFW